MKTEGLSAILVEQQIINSRFLERDVIVDFYLPKNINHPSGLSLLLINDGQNMSEMNFSNLLNDLIVADQIEPVFCVGVHANEERKMEYGTAKVLDYMGRGAKAAAYQQFIIEELLPYIHCTYHIEKFYKKSIAGFSLGGLTAMDMVWNHPDLFSIAGVFSGSLWWRTKSLDDNYNEETDRIMHQQVKQGTYYSGLKFFFTTGSLDETADRNNNGIIDSIDDTLALIAELEKLGYDVEKDIEYINYEDGKHDVPTWGRAMPLFLRWGWGKVHHQPVIMNAESC